YCFGPLVKRLRHRPFTAVTRVRVPYGSLILLSSRRITQVRLKGTVLKTVRRVKARKGSNPLSSLLILKLKIHWSGGVGVNMPACHAGDRGFKSRPDRYIMRV